VFSGRYYLVPRWGSMVSGTAFTKGCRSPTEYNRVSPDSRWFWGQDRPFWHWQRQVARDVGAGGRTSQLTAPSRWNARSAITKAHLLCPHPRLLTPEALSCRRRRCPQPGDEHQDVREHLPRYRDLGQTGRWRSGRGWYLFAPMLISLSRRLFRDHWLPAALGIASVRMQLPSFVPRRRERLGANQSHPLWCPKEWLGDRIELPRGRNPLNPPLMISASVGGHYQEFRGVVGHDGSEGARLCRDANCLVFLAPFLTSC